MTILGTIKADMNAARVARHTATVNSLVTLYSDIERIGKDEQREVTDADSVKVIKKFIKNAEETLSYLSEEVIIKEYSTEIALFNKYLPKQLSEVELNDVINAQHAISPFANMGAVMGWLKANHAGLYNGADASKIAKSLF